MNPTRFSLYFRILFSSLALLTLPELAYSDSDYLDNPIRAVTLPSKDVMLSFVQSGRIEKVHVEQGQTVKAGQSLVQLDDAVEQAKLAQLKALSENTANVEASQANLDQKRVDLQKFEWAYKRGSVPKLEFEHRVLDVTIAELSLKIAEFELEQNKRKYNEEKIRIDRMQLKSPIDGKIEQIQVEPGESVDYQTDEVVRIVDIDPLWIDVSVPLAQAKTLKLGQTATVKFPDPDQTTAKGKILFIAAVTDASGSTLTTRVQLPNSSNRPAGEQVSVTFPKID